MMILKIMYQNSLILLIGTLLFTGCGGGDGGSGSRTSETVVFTSDKDVAGKRELYAIQDDGSELVKLSGNLLSGGVGLFKLSPDKTKVAYSAIGDTAGVTDLYVANVDGTEVIRVSQGLNSYSDVYHGNTSDAFWWSPDSTRLVYLADTDIDGIQELFLVNADGSDHHKINGSVGSTVKIGQAQWSPDSRYVAYFVRSRTPFYSGYAVDRIAINTHDTSIGGRNSIRVSGTVPANQTDWVNGFVWSPDSTRIAYTSYENTSGVRELYIAIAGQTTQQTRVNVALSANQSVMFRLYWSDDSRYLLYSITGSSPGGLYTHDTQNLTPRNGTKISGNLNSGTNIYNYAWSPDGSRIAYIAEASEKELFSALPDVANSAVILNGTLPAGSRVMQFRWSPDSTRLAYIADQDVSGVQEVYTVAAAGGGATNKISHDNLRGSSVSHRFSWSPDGQHIAYEVTGDQAGLYVTRPGDNLATYKVSGDEFTPMSRFSYQPYIDEYYTMSAWSQDSEYLIFSASVDTSLRPPEPYLLYRVGINETQPSNITGSLVAGSNGVGALDY